MAETERRRPMARPVRHRDFRMVWGRKEDTPEQIAERNAAETARKIRRIFALRETPPQIQNEK